MWKKLSLDKSIAEIARRLKEHIGSNGDAHLPVSTDIAGFMTPEILDKFNMMFKNRIMQPNGTDILTLSPGFYEGSGWLNHPNGPTTPTTWISSITVTQGTDGRKQIWLQDNISGYTWNRTIHTGGDPESGTGAWLRLYQYEILWSGNSSLDDAVTLAHPVANEKGVGNYSSIRITYQGTAIMHAYGSQYGVNLWNVNPHDTQGVIYSSVEESKIRFPTATTAKATVRTGQIYKAKSESDNTLVGIPFDPGLTVVEITGLR